MEKISAVCFPLYPTKDQLPALLQQAGNCRYIWNWALFRRKEYYQQNKKGMPNSQLSKELTQHRNSLEWLSLSALQFLQQVLRDLDKSFSNFFSKRAKFPKVKKKHKCLPKFRIPQNIKIDYGQDKRDSRGGFKTRNGSIRIPKVGRVRMRIHKEIKGEVCYATIKCDSTGQWCASITSKENVTRPLPMEEPSTVGMDVGLRDSSFAVLDKGDGQEERIQNPRCYRTRERKLRKVQKALSRSKEGSNRRKKAKYQVAKVHKKTANKRKDFLHKTTCSIIRRFDNICIEDLNIKGLAKTKQAKSFMDAAHGEFVRQLKYKAEWNGKTVVQVNRFYPSSKTCHTCGFVHKGLGMEEYWACPNCGTKHNRDTNAARNLRKEGLEILAGRHSDRLNARRGDVRPQAARVQADSDEARIDSCSNFCERLAETGLKTSSDSVASRNAAPNFIPGKELQRQE